MPRPSEAPTTLAADINVPHTLTEWLALEPTDRDAHRTQAIRRSEQAAESHHAYLTVCDGIPATGGGGELRGIPFAVKANIDVAGEKITAASPVFASRVPEVDADLVSLLRDAGAVVAGIANMHELAFGGTSNNAAHGPVRNPYDPTRVAGGSSGGSAAAVALGCVPFSLGTDTGGSVIVPSAFCGIAGFRPTTGRYPAAGVLHLSTSRDTIGLHAHTVQDIRLLDRVITRAAGTSAPSLSNLTLGRVASRFDDLEDEVAAITDQAITRLRDLGITVVDVDLGDDIDLAAGPGIDLVFYETEHLMPGQVAVGQQATPAFADLVDRVASPDVRSIAEAIATTHVSGDRYEAARRARWELRRRYDRAFRETGVHALVGPTAAVLPPPIGDDLTISVNGQNRPTFATIIRNAGPGSVAGVPMLTIPAGHSMEGLPVGLCLEGTFFDDDAILATGETLENALAVPSHK